jgi:hypothetical protein
MTMRQRLVGATPWGSGRLTSERLGRLAEDNARLKAENTALREEFKEAHSLQKRMLEALENRPVVEVKKRRVGLIGTLLVAGGACMVGMRIGREQYERLIGTARERLGVAKERLGRSLDEQMVTVPDATPPEREEVQEPETSSASATSRRTSSSREKE